MVTYQQLLEILVIELQKRRVLIKYEFWPPCGKLIEIKNVLIGSSRERKDRLFVSEVIKTLLKEPS